MRLDVSVMNGKDRPELRRRAGAHLRRERVGHTLRPAAWSWLLTAMTVRQADLDVESSVRLDILSPM
jgi:hypothetical protein